MDDYRQGSSIIGLGEFPQGFWISYYSRNICPDRTHATSTRLIIQSKEIGGRLCQHRIRTYLSNSKFRETWVMAVKEV